MIGNILFVLAISIALGAAGYMIYWNNMIASYQNYAGDAIDYLARMTDGDDLLSCMRSGKKSEKYLALQDLSNDFKETHDLLYIYIIEPLRKNPPDNMMDVLAAYTSWGKADGTDGLTDLGNYTGDAYPPEVAEQYMNRMDRDPRVTYFRNDTDFGRIYTAIRPIFDGNGNPIAVICGDILIDEIYGAAASYALMAGAIALVIGALVVFIMDRWLYRRVIGPVARLGEVAEDFEQKCRERADVENLTMEDPNISTQDEVEALSVTISSMVKDVQEYAKDLLSKEGEIVNLKEHVNKMDVLAYRDSLTGAGNKAAYEKTKVRLEWDVLSGGAEFAIIMADLNYLKRINDTFGHDKGNEYIKKLYSMIIAVFIESPVFRIGGDEFVIITQGEEMEHTHELLEIIKRKMDEVSHNRSLDPWERVSTAFGYAKYDPSMDSCVDDVFKRADAAMYEEKKAMHASRE